MTEVSKWGEPLSRPTSTLFGRVVLYRRVGCLQFCRDDKAVGPLLRDTDQAQQYAAGKGWKLELLDPGSNITPLPARPEPAKAPRAALVRPADPALGAPRAPLPTLPDGRRPLKGQPVTKRGRGAARGKGR